MTGHYELNDFDPSAQWDELLATVREVSVGPASILLPVPSSGYYPDGGIAQVIRDASGIGTPWRDSSETVLEYRDSSNGSAPGLRIDTLDEAGRPYSCVIALDPASLSESGRRDSNLELLARAATRLASAETRTTTARISGAHYYNVQDRRNCPASVTITYNPDGSHTIAVGLPYTPFRTKLNGKSVTQPSSLIFTVDSAGELALSSYAVKYGSSCMAGSAGALAPLPAEVVAQVYENCEFNSGDLAQILMTSVGATRAYMAMAY